MKESLATNMEPPTNKNMLIMVIVLIFFLPTRQSMINNIKGVNFLSEKYIETFIAEKIIRGELKPNVEYVLDALNGEIRLLNK